MSWSVSESYRQCRTLSRSPAKKGSLPDRAHVGAHENRSGIDGGGLFQISDHVVGHVPHGDGLASSDVEPRLEHNGLLADPETLSGILLSHERTFAMYQDLSLRFYAGGPDAFALYTHYLYEKIFGEGFLRAVPAETLETMRQRFHERYKDRVHALVRLTEAQNPFFEGLEDRLDEYRAVETPVLLCAGSQDRVLPRWQQTKMLDIFPDTRYELVEGAGHVVYLEKKEIFFPMLKEFMRAKATDFEMPADGRS